MKKEIIVVTACIFSSLLQAQTGIDSTRTLDEVLLTSNKYPKKQSETGKIVTVIGRDVLEKSTGKNIGEIINTIAGVNVISANNNRGSNLTLSIRGASAGNALVLIDGVPVNDPSVNNNYFDLNLISPEQVERIEVMKGGHSTLYGSDAVTGVVNIILKKSGADGFHADALLAYGSYQTFQQGLNLHGRKNKFNYSAGYQHLSSIGFSAAHDAVGTGNFDRDGISQHNANARVGFQVSEKLLFHLSGIYSKYDTELDASGFTDEKDFNAVNDNGQVVAGAELRHNKGTTRVNYSYNYVERDYYDDSLFKSSFFVDWAKSRFIGVTHFAELYNSMKWNNWELLTGVDYRSNRTDQFYRSQSPAMPPFTFEPSIFETSIRKKTMNQLSPYASLVYKYKGFTMEAGGRLNFHSEYGSNATYTFNPSYTNGSFKYFANLYSAFKAPTLYQLFDPWAGNTDLQPEKSNLYEAGVEYFGAYWKLRGAGFYSRTSNAIVYTFDPVNSINTYDNVSKQVLRGFETEFVLRKKKWTINANYTFNDGEISTSFDGTGSPLGKDTSYNNLYRIPRHAVNLTTGYQLTPAFYISAAMRAISEREEFVYGGSPEKLAGYFVFDVYSEYKWKNLKLFADFRNVTDREYFEIKGYNSRRFNFMTGVKWSL